MQCAYSIVIVSAVLFTSIALGEKLTPQEQRKKYFYIKKITPYAPSAHCLECPPQILSAETQEYPESNKPVTVVIETKDGTDTIKERSIKITQGKIYYSVKSKEWQEVSLKKQEGNDNLWEGVLPPFPEGTEVQYYTWFQDEYENMATETKPDFQKDHDVDIGKGKTFLFPSEEDMVLVYEYQHYDPVDEIPIIKKNWLHYAPQVLEKARITKMFFAQDEDYYYLLIELKSDEKEIFALYPILEGTWLPVTLRNTDILENPNKEKNWDVPIPFNEFTYWLTLPEDFFDTPETNCRFCFLEVTSTMSI